jgi:3D (Asp-Asp-Asp) domain-containing protein
VRIPGLPGELGKTDFVSDDVGASVHGKHIDIYTGEGREAEKRMAAVTFEEKNELQHVCYLPPESGHGSSD